MNKAPIFARPVFGPWEAEFSDLISSAQRRLVLCTPFISASGVEALLSARRNRTPLLDQPVVLTNLSPRALCQGATDARATLGLAVGLGAGGVFHVPSLHAKVYIADASRAAVTSGNLTDGGLRRNHEYGVILEDSTIVGAVESDLLALSSLGSWLPCHELEPFVTQAEAAREAALASESGASARARARLASALAAADDSLIRARLKGGPVHRVFTETIRHLLRTSRGMSTIQLHAAIQRIHPDLCDDRVDRVIDGQRFGKKWKHAVRTSQQHLKKLGEIKLDGGVWRLVGADRRGP